MLSGAGESHHRIPSNTSWRDAGAEAGISRHADGYKRIKRPVKANRVELMVWEFGLCGVTLPAVVYERGKKRLLGVLPGECGSEGLLGRGRAPTFPHGHYSAAARPGFISVVACAPAWESGNEASRCFWKAPSVSASNTWLQIRSNVARVCFDVGGGDASTSVSEHVPSRNTVEWGGRWRRRRKWKEASRPPP